MHLLSLAIGFLVGVGGSLIYMHTHLAKAVAASATFAAATAAVIAKV